MAIYVHAALEAFGAVLKGSTRDGMHAAVSGTYHDGVRPAALHDGVESFGQAFILVNRLE